MAPEGLGESPRILIVRTGALGDVVNALPLAMVLKDARPRAHIAWVVHPRAAAIVTGHPAIDEVIVWDRAGGVRALARVVARLRSGRFDVALDLGRTAKTALLALGAGAARRVGFDRARCKEMAWLTGGERIPAAPPVPLEARPPEGPGIPRGAGPHYRRAPEPGGHVTDQFLEFARYLSVPVSAIRWGIAPREAAAGRAQALWPAGSGPRVALVPSATKPSNRWPVSRWSDLARRAASELGARVALVGASADRALTREIATQAGGPASVGEGGRTRGAALGPVAGAAADAVPDAAAGAVPGAAAGAVPDAAAGAVPGATHGASTGVPAAEVGPIVDLAGRTDVDGLVAVLALADAVVSGDTGPLHLAVALGRPVVAVYGPADPLRTGPYGRPDAVIAQVFACSPCRRRRCPLGEPSPCLDALDVAAVLDRLVRTLSR